MFLKRRCSHLTIKSYHRNLPSPFASTSTKKPQIVQVVSEVISRFSLINKCFLLSCSSKNAGLIVLENQLFKVSTVNFSSTENNSAREVDFSRSRTAVAASFSCQNVVLSKNGTCSRLKWLRS